MSESAVRGVLGRMVGQGSGSGDGETSPWAQVWHVVIPRAADECLGVDAALLRAGQRTAELTNFLENLPDTGLFLRLAGPGASVGLLHFDAGCLAAVLEAQTLGRVLRADPPERAGTKTDSAIVTPVIARFLSAATREAAERGEKAPPWTDFAIRGRIGDKRAVELQLGEGSVHVLRIEIDFSGGAKTGVLSLVLRPEAELAAGKAGGANRADFAESVMGAATRLSVVLDRPRVPIGWVRGLKVGDDLTIARARLSDARVETTDGRFLATARLGQAAGQRAVRLTLGKAASAPSASVTGMQALPAEGPTQTGLTALRGGVDDLPNLPDGHATDGDFSDVPGGANRLPDQPDLPGSQRDIPGSPDLSDLPELPDLPNLPTPG